MKIKKVVKKSNPSFTFYEKGKIILDENYEISLVSDCGVFVLSYKIGAVFDGCSAPFFMRWMLPKYGDQKYSTAWLVHDHLFDSHGLSFDVANDVFYQLLIIAGVSKVKARLAKFGVSTKIGRNHYENKRDTINDGKLGFHWEDK